MSRVARAAIATLLLAALGAPTTAAATSSKPPPVTCQHHNDLGQCIVTVRDPGRGTHGGGTGGGTQKCTDLFGQTIPCNDPVLGYWDQALNCYLHVAVPQPPRSSPIWQGHTDGAIYLCTSWPPNTTGVADLWFATPPVGANTATLALTAENQLALPQPSGHRSPNESQEYRGHPYTYVNLWTWFWTDAAMWHARTATARAGGVSATVTVTPIQVTFDPGDGSAAATCAGPGRPWTSDDGNSAPSNGGCGYLYTAATQSPITSTQSIDWSVTWTASDGTSGTLPDLITTKAGQLMVLQVQSVVSR